MAGIPCTDGAPGAPGGVVRVLVRCVWVAGMVLAGGLIASGTGAAESEAPQPRPSAYHAPLVVSDELLDVIEVPDSDLPDVATPELDLPERAALKLDMPALAASEPEAPEPEASQTRPVAPETSGSDEATGASDAGTVPETTTAPTPEVTDLSAQVPILGVVTQSVVAPAVRAVEEPVLDAVVQPVLGMVVQPVVAPVLPSASGQPGSCGGMPGAAATTDQSLLPSAPQLAAVTSGEPTAPSQAGAVPTTELRPGERATATGEGGGDFAVPGDSSLASSAACPTTTTGSPTISKTSQNSATDNGGRALPALPRHWRQASGAVPAWSLTERPSTSPD